MNLDLTQVSQADSRTLQTLRMFTDSDLVSQTRMLIREEAKATRQVLLHLMESTSSNLPTLNQLAKLP
jgi:hypothetical protein